MVKVSNRAMELKQRKRLVKDIHKEYSDINVLGGVGGLTHIHKGVDWMLPVKYSILVPTQNQRGVHMSRLVAAAQRHSEGERIEHSMRDICREVNKTQPGCRVVCDLQYPYKDHFMPITIKMGERGKIRYTFQRTGITACPCSKQMVGVGHMQRTVLKLKVANDDIQDFDEVAEMMGECFSTIPEEHLKREDEGEKIMEAQERPRFAEDVVRECLRRFPNAISIEARSLESIHLHDAIAYWSRRKNHNNG
jgi:GTP cyclohydrolase FolE2